MIELLPKQDELHRLAACMLKDNTNEKTILASLENKGIAVYYAEIILTDVKKDVEDRTLLCKHLMNGAVVFSCGLFLTTVTYFAIAPIGIYYIFPAIMLVGVGSLIRSFLILKAGLSNPNFGQLSSDTKASLKVNTFYCQLLTH